MVATYQSPGKGDWIEDFYANRSLAAGQSVPAPTAHRAQLVGVNVITPDWTLDANGFTEEENKVVNENAKCGDATIGVCLTCVRVPVKVAHSEAVTVEFHKPISVAEAKAALAKAPGIVFMDETKDGKFPQPIHAEGSDHTFVGRVRQDPSNPNGLCCGSSRIIFCQGCSSNAGFSALEELVKRGIVEVSEANSLRGRRDPDPSVEGGRNTSAICGITSNRRRHIPRIIAKNGRRHFSSSLFIASRNRVWNCR